MCSHMCAGTDGQGRSSTHSHLWVGGTGGMGSSWKPAPTIPGRREGWVGSGIQDPRRDRERPRLGEWQKYWEQGKKAVRVLKESWRQKEGQIVTAKGKRRGQQG